MFYIASSIFHLTYRSAIYTSQFSKIDGHLVLFSSWLFRLGILILFWVLILINLGNEELEWSVAALKFNLNDFINGNSSGSFNIHLCQLLPQMLVLLYLGTP